MRQKIVAGNWKMNNTLSEGVLLVEEILEQRNKLNNSDVLTVIAPPFIHLEKVSELLKGKKGIELAAQNCNDNHSGAYTGEVSAKMLASVGCKYVIIGHSERRQYFNESNELLAKKVESALSNNLVPIFCIGENLDERNASEYFSVLNKQMGESLFHLSASDFSRIVIAYEPVWAIGTGNTASTEQVQEVHNFIRFSIKKQYGDDVASATTLLYGGSCNPQNAESIFACEDVDGGLIGGASLKSDDFISIINSF